MDNEQLEKKIISEQIYIQIFTVSGAMVGVCLTVIGIFQVVFQIDKLNTLGDNLVAFAGALFLAACFLSYFALRARSIQRSERLEKATEIVFLMALGLMAAVCFLVVYAVV
jgi:uncharacterized membrane protein YqjE